MPAAVTASASFPHAQSFRSDDGGRAGLVTTETGIAILQALQQGSSVHLTVPADGHPGAIEDTFYGGTPSSFTSWGPLYDLTRASDLS